jgi:hypothetical protein
VTVVPTSETEAQQWRYTTTKPADDWHRSDFDDSAWMKGAGGFGTSGTPGAVVRTEWNGKEIWLRRTFTFKEAKFNDLHLRVHHDEDAQVYVNGQLVADLVGYSTEYYDTALPPAALKAFRPGTNTLAVRCKQTGGGQYIDVGFVDLTEKPRPQK